MKKEKKLSELPPDLSMQKLSAQEISNPYQVIEDLFQFARLPELRQLLWTSFKTNITGTYSVELDSKERYELVYLHEFLEKLLEVAFLLNEKHKSENQGYIVRDIREEYAVSPENN